MIVWLIESNIYKVVYFTTTTKGVRKCFKKNIKVNRAKQALKNKEARFLTK